MCWTAMLLMRYSSSIFYQRSYRRTLHQEVTLEFYCRHDHSLTFFDSVTETYTL